MCITCGHFCGGDHALLRTKACLALKAACRLQLFLEPAKVHLLNVIAAYQRGV